MLSCLKDASARFDTVILSDLVRLATQLRRPGQL